MHAAPLTICIIAIGIILSATEINAKVLPMCTAVQELKRGGISNTYISNWVCLMKHESGLETSLVTGPGTASSYSYGVFQINSNKWCVRGRKGGVCNAKCEDFSNDDISDDIVCAKKIHEMEGFKYWKGWMNKCKNKPLPDISSCKRRRRAIDDLLFEVM
ncbi:hypothetical protein PV326_012758 [Microctonus aethiopoides]|nr:hypothetical protein PV326_012758 [Microctonus aethiopoides]